MYDSFDITEIQIKILELKTKLTSNELTDQQRNAIRLEISGLNNIIASKAFVGLIILPFYIGFLYLAIKSLFLILNSF